MPSYDFRCRSCGQDFTLTYASIAEAGRSDPRCPRCQSAELSRLIRRVAVISSEESRIERLADPSRLAGLDENDPRAMGRLMRDMANELGEDAGPEVDEVIERLESGENPETIEQSMSSGDMGV
jgi:putative FmdB family regulatory protein